MNMNMGMGGMPNNMGGNMGFNPMMNMNMGAGFGGNYIFEKAYKFRTTTKYGRKLWLSIQVNMTGLIHFLEMKC